MAEPALPDYDDLPIREGLPPGSAWGVWGDDDKFGCLNLLTPERIAAAATLVRKGTTFAMNFDYDLPDPPLFGRQAPVHEVLGDGGHDDVLHFNTQSSSQWDGFRHVRNHHGHFNGVSDEEHGIHWWAERGLAGRAVLLDVARWRESVGRPIDGGTNELITPDDLDGTLTAQGTTLQTGDVLLLRTGWTTWYRAADRATRDALPQQLRAPGLRPGQDMLRWLWNHHVAAIGADNPAVEACPLGGHLSQEQREGLRDEPDRSYEFFLHLALLPLLGIPLGEMWDLDALADDCAEDGVYEGFFTSAPLRVRGGVASPPNAIVVK